MGISSFLSVCNDSRSVYWFVVHCSATLANMQEITCCEAGHSVYYTSCNFITIVEWRCFTRLSKYGISSDLGQSSVKFISAAAAWAWTRWLSWSSMVCRRAAITWNRSVHLQRSKFLNGTLFFLGHCFTAYLLMKFLLEARCKVSCHLSNCITSSISHSRMLKNYFPQMIKK